MMFTSTFIKVPLQLFSQEVIEQTRIILAFREHTRRTLTALHFSIASFLLSSAFLAGRLFFFSTIFAMSFGPSNFRLSLLHFGLNVSLLVILLDLTCLKEFIFMSLSFFVLGFDLGRLLFCHIFTRSF